MRRRSIPGAPEEKGKGKEAKGKGEIADQARGASLDIFPNPNFINANIEI